MNIEDALAQLAETGDAYKAGEMAAYHKTARRFLGVGNAAIFEACAEWRADATLEERVTLATELWDSDVHEARVAAAKLLVQARINPDADVWELIASWVPALDCAALSDHVCGAGSRRLSAEPARLDEVEAWTTSQNRWVKRSALVMTLPWTKQKHPKDHELEVRERVLTWSAEYLSDPDPMIHMTVAEWVRELGRRDAARAWAFMDAHGAAMKPHAVKDASRKLPAR